MKLVNALLDTSLVSATDNVVAVQLDGKGPLTSEEVKAISAKLDEWIKFKNPILEAIDGPIIKLIVSAINDKALDRLSPEFQEILAELLRELFPTT